MTAETMKLTFPQFCALKRIANGQWDRGVSRGGGAYRRMLARLNVDGLVTPPPYKLTPKGWRQLKHDPRI